MHKQSAATDQYHGHLLFLLVIIFLIVYLMLTFYNPELVQKRSHGKALGPNDVSVTMLWSMAITLFILVLLGLLWYAFTCYH